MIALSSNFLLIAFFLYLVSTIFFAVSVTGKKFRDKAGEVKGNRWGLYGFIASIIAFLFAAGYIIIRWVVSGHAPVSNMFEYGTFLGIMMGLAFIIIYAIYRTNILGLFTVPTIMLIIAYASVFPSEVSPLIPALQSIWLQIHVMTTALGQGILSIGFAAGLMYLVRTLDFKKKNIQTRSIEIIFYLLLSVLGFVFIGYIFGAMNYETTFTNVHEELQEETMTYNIPALIGPSGGQLPDDFKGLHPFFYAPEWMKSKDLNTVVWSLLSGVVLYFLLRLIFRRPIGAVLQKLVKGLTPQTIDEVSYRAIAIGFPIFTLGGLIFAMIWAQIAWTRFWGWDPKEVWALITFLFYAAYLHLRLSRGWIGARSAWLCVIGFAIIMFNFVFVNLVIAGLHSYAL